MTNNTMTIQSFWQQTGGKSLFQGVALSDLLQSLDKRLLFAPPGEPLVLVCVDERVHDDLTLSCVALAGSGIFDQDNSPSWIRYAKPKAITYHPDCGACAVYAEQNNLCEDPLHIAKKWAHELSTLLDIPCYQISAEQMSGPEGFHPARGIVIDGTGRIQLQKFPKELPPMFTSSFGAFPEQAKEYLLQEITMILQIAFGDHGYGELLSEETPFFVWIIGSKREERLEEQELLKNIQPLIEPYGAKIRVMSTTAHF